MSLQNAKPKDLLHDDASTTLNLFHAVGFLLYVHHHDGWPDFRESAPYIGCCRSVFHFITCPVAWLTGSILWRAKFLTLSASRIRKQCPLQRSHTTQPAANKQEATQFYKDRRVNALAPSVPFSRAIDTIRLANCRHPIAGPARWRAVVQHTMLVR